MTSYKDIEQFHTFGNWLDALYREKDIPGYGKLVDSLEAFRHNVLKEARK